MTRLICVRGLTMFELCVFVVDDKYPHTPTRKQHTWTGRLQELTRKGENIDRPELFEGGVKTRSAGQRGRPEQEKLQTSSFQRRQLILQHQRGQTSQGSAGILARKASQIMAGQRSVSAFGLMMDR